jgi:hypothetical protein
MRLERDDTETRGLRGLGKGDVRGVVEVVLGEHLIVLTNITRPGSWLPVFSFVNISYCGPLAECKLRNSQQSYSPRQ